MVNVNSKSKLVIIILIILGLALAAAKASLIKGDGSLLGLGNLSDASHPPPAAEANIGYFKSADPKVVLLGDSIINGWELPDEVNGYRLVNRGVSGETTGDLLGRFKQDVIIPRPRYVVILVGINDVALTYETDPSGIAEQLPKIAGNIRLMAEQAKSKGIVPLVCSVLPVNCHYRIDAAAINLMVNRLNQELAAAAQAGNYIFVDFWPAVLDSDTGLLKNDYAADGIHPNQLAYAQMWNLLLPHLK